ncbi:LOW QUALITY PROTEIN: protein AF-17 [Clupea harengus]|uniref:LOW QUALITY PROTEIN: protein AF-17 n=1 Tax=Clupea harengus TaxID=7950 RepID=A0A6P8EN49_CLUHA|nr:LOW QUALITY PROTEIN: protein AF-17 [Clupea harengus]
MREMVGGCCVCSDERGWAENPLVYCDGHGCSVAVHQACYGIVQVPTGPWFCRKCESQERAARVRCELCPHKDGALKRTDSGGWAHVVCALYIPEVQFANVLTMEPIVLQYVPHERYIKTCYICEDHGRESKAACGACMTCNRPGCRQAFHVTCAQMAGLLCEEEGPEADNVKYCGYCKHHYSKMQKKLRSSGETLSSSFNHARGRSSSPSQDKHSSHHHRPRKSHKPDKMKLKERHKKSPDGMGSPLSTTMEKLSSSHHSSSKDGEIKPKKLSLHGLAHRSSSKKPGSGFKSCSSSCSSSPFNAGGTSLPSSQDFLQLSSSSSCRLEREPEEPTRPDPPSPGRSASAGASRKRTRRKRRRRKRRRRASEEVVEEEEEEEEEEEKEVKERESKYHKPPALQPPALTPANGPPEAEANTFETKVTISTFGSIMRITSSSGLGGAGGGSKVRKMSSKSSSSRAPQSTPPVLEESVPPERQSSSPSLPRERRHRGNKKSRHGPGRPRGSKNREREKRGEDEQQQQQHHHRHHHHHHQPTQTQSQAQPQGQQQGGALAFSAPFSGPASLPPAAFPTSTTNSLISSGIYSSHKDPLSLGGGVCSTPLSTGLLPSHRPSLPLTPANSTANTQVHSGPGVPYSLSASQPFSSFLSTAPTLPPLLSQAQSTLPESEMDDCRYPCRDSSPRESLSSQSPMSSLPLLFDQREGVEHLRSRLENVPPASSHIELLLEKHGNGETGVNIVDTLQSLHSLQQENQRLQDQILSLTAKKDRLQLLNVELAVPFVPPGAPPTFAHAHIHGHGHVHLPSLQAAANLATNPVAVAAQINANAQTGATATVPAGFLSCAHDPLSSSKSPLTKSSFLSDNSFITSSEDLHSGSPSRSSSSFSFQSTPPTQQSPASFSQPLLNGLGRGLSESLAGIGGGGGLMDGLAGGPQLSGVNGLLGALNGVMGSAQVPQGHLPALQPQAPPLNPGSGPGAADAQEPQPVKWWNDFVVFHGCRSSLLSDHQKQLLLQKQQQQQLQEILVLKQFTPEQQMLVYQILQQQQQQQRQRDLQRLSLGGSLPSSAPCAPLISPSPGLLPQANASPMQANQGSALFGLQENSLHKPGVRSHILPSHSFSCR